MLSPQWVWRAKDGLTLTWLTASGLSAGMTEVTGLPVSHPPADEQASPVLAARSQGPGRRREREREEGTDREGEEARLEPAQCHLEHFALAQAKQRGQPDPWAGDTDPHPLKGEAAESFVDGVLTERRENGADLCNRSAAPHACFPLLLLHTCSFYQSRRKSELGWGGLEISQSPVTHSTDGEPEAPGGKEICQGLPPHALSFGSGSGADWKPSCTS